MARKTDYDRKKLKDTFKYIVDYKRAHEGASPSLDDIASETGQSKSGAHYNLRVLEADTAISIKGTRDIRVNGGKWEME
jgi:hypothetical protein